MISSLALLALSCSFTEVPSMPYTCLATIVLTCSFIWGFPKLGVRSWGPYYTGILLCFFFEGPLFSHPEPLQRVKWVGLRVFCQRQIGDDGIYFNNCDDGLHGPIAPSPDFCPKPSIPQPLNPSTPQPLNPSTPQPLNPSTPQPLNPSTPQPLNPSTPQPLNPSTPQPLNPSTPQPLNPSTPQPLNP